MSSILEKSNYNPDKLELICDHDHRQFCGKQKEEVQHAAYSIAYQNLDHEIKEKIGRFLKRLDFVEDVKIL